MPKVAQLSKVEEPKAVPLREKLTDEKVRELRSDRLSQEFAAKVADQIAREVAWKASDDVGKEDWGEIDANGEGDYDYSGYIGAANTTWQKVYEDTYASWYDTMEELASALVEAASQPLNEVWGHVARSNLFALRILSPEAEAKRERIESESGS